jgi:nucleotide-binding universal stress UspA family protein
MKKIERILFPTDFSSCARFAAGNALAFAKQCGAELYLLHASLLYASDPNDPDKPFPTDEDHREVLPQPEPYVRRRMTELLSSYSHEGVTVQQVQIRGYNEVTSIKAYLRENAIDVVVMGTHGRRGFKRWLLGSVAEEIVRTVECPVITVKDGWEGNLAKPESILVPLDFSTVSRHALREAYQLAITLGTSLELLHVVQEPFFQDLYGTDIPNPERFQAETSTKAREIMQNMLAEDDFTNHPGVATKVTVIHGHPAREIVRYAKTAKSGLIFMAHRGHTQLVDRILGSVTEHVVRTARCPVWTADIDG